MMEDKFVEQQGTYMLSHSVGLPLKTAKSIADVGFWQPWSTGGANVWDHWLAGIERFRAGLGTLLNSDSHQFCPQSNLSSAVNKIIFSLARPDPKKVILMSEEDFPSVAYALQQSSVLGYQIRYIPRNLGLNNMQVWDEYLTDDVALVLVTQVQSNNGTQLPVAEITAMANKRSVLSLVDVAQSIGIIPIDIQRWRADFIVGSCVKWLSGGPGAGFLWVGEDVIDRCQPQNVGWFSHEDPFAFDIHDFRYANDALKFWGGTPSVHPFLVASASLDFVIDLGVEAIRKHNLAMADRIINALEKEELVSPLEPNHRSGTLILHFGASHDSMVNKLKNSDVSFDSRSKGIRLSPHIYNSVHQIDQLIRSINDNR